MGIICSQQLRSKRLLQHLLPLGQALRRLLTKPLRLEPVNVILNLPRARPLDIHRGTMQGVITEHTRRHLGDVLGGRKGQALLCPALLEPLGELVAGLGHPGTNRVDADAVAVGRVEVCAERAHEALDAVLGGLVDGDDGGFFEAGGAGEEEDGPVDTGAAVVAEVDAGDAGDVQCADEVHVDVFAAGGLTCQHLP